MNRDFSHYKRIVIKIGTNLLRAEDGINTDFLADVADQVARAAEKGYQPLIVSSGAIGLGAGELGYTQKVQSIQKRQAFASIGQPLLMDQYRRAFKAHNLVVAQILLTRSILNNRKSFINLKNSVEALLALGVVPIVNENDSVSTDEIGTAFGDNDTLSALVASKIDADLLLILTDIDGLYDRDPKKHADAKLVPTVEVVDARVRSWAAGAGSSFSTGGMQTKLKAAEIAARAGCGCVIAKGDEPQIILQILAGKQLGTYVYPAQRMAQRSRWIMQSVPSGTIHVDQGAVDALKANKSLLPSGVVSVEGVFDKGAVVMINDVAKAVPSFNSREIETLIGVHSSSIRERVGEDRRDVIARPEDIVFLET
ncbi:MAG: glutamate 5-kinase [Spirochaetota bacterium]